MSIGAHPYQTSRSSSSTARTNKSRRTAVRFSRSYILRSCAGSYTALPQRWEHLVGERPTRYVGVVKEGVAKEEIRVLRLLPSTSSRPQVAETALTGQ